MSLFRTEQLEYGGFLHYPDLSIPKDAVTFITGESGCGKSTLLRLLNATFPPSAGKIFYNDLNLEEYDTIALRREVLLISQEVFLFDGSISENFTQFYRYRGLPAPDRALIERMLEVCRLTFPLSKNCATMSGGERQRLYMAIYLSFGSKVVLLDEPTSALDSANSHGVIENILTFCREQKMQAIVVSHDHELTERFAENVVLLERQVG